MAAHGNTWFRVDSTADYETHPAGLPERERLPPVRHLILWPANKSIITATAPGGASHLLFS